MFEATATSRTQTAIQVAHVQRGEAMRALFRVTLGMFHIPLGRSVLTDTSRCPG